MRLICADFLDNRVKMLTLPEGGMVVVFTNNNSPLLESAAKSHAMDLTDYSYYAL